MKGIDLITIINVVLNSILLILVVIILFLTVNAHAEDNFVPTVTPLYILNDDNTEYYTIGIWDRSNCPGPTLLIYSPDCAKWVEVMKIPKDLYEKSISKENQ